MSMDMSMGDAIAKVADYILSGKATAEDWTEGVTIIRCIARHQFTPDEGVNYFLDWLSK